MDREIKFRAWDKDEKCMIYNVQDTYDYKCGNDGALAESFKEVLEDKNRYDVMEFIGLPSIKGEDIYEGDIVRRRSYTDYDAYANVSEIRGVVEFRDYAWCIVQRSEDERDYVTPLFMEAEFGLVREIEILGNIYENPELASTVGVVGYTEANVRKEV